MADAALRLDRFLWFARFARSRAIARQMVESGRVRIDGRRVERVAQPVRVGAVLTFAQGGSVRVIRVERLPVRRGPASEAASCVTDLSPGVDEPVTPT